MKNTPKNHVFLKYLHFTKTLLDAIFSFFLRFSLLVCCCHGKRLLSYFSFQKINNLKRIPQSIIMSKSVQYSRSYDDSKTVSTANLLIFRSVYPPAPLTDENYKRVWSPTYSEKSFYKDLIPSTLTTSE